MVKLTFRQNTVRTSVNLPGIMSMFAPGGDVFKTARAWAFESRQYMVATAPRRTGGLAGAHGIPSVTPQGLGVMYTVANRSRHAIWVHNGTTGPITPKRHQYLQLPGGPRAKSVRGQRAQPWMEDAMNAVLAKHGIR